MSIAQMVLISPKAKRIHLQRFLLSKFVHFKEKTELRDLCCLFENQLWLERKCLSDPVFCQKFGRDLESLSVILSEINFRQETTVRAIDRFSTRLQRELPELVLPKRNYLEAFKRLNGSFSLKDSKPLGRLKSTIPPKSRIGIGYRDKGSARDVAKDGSPSWQEVAAHRGPLYHKGKKYENLQDSETVAGRVLKDLERILRSGEGSEIP